MQIEAEQPADLDAIARLTEAAFRNLPHSDQREAQIISALREANALLLSLVMRDADTVIGHIAFSPVTLTDSDGAWHGLGPVSVDPLFQGKGIGSGLITEGLKRLKAMGSAGCTVVGDLAFYQRFGFQHIKGLGYTGIPDQYVMAQAFGDERPIGLITYHQAFGA